jgi:chemotaxis protein methyltransferase CheR
MFCNSAISCIIVPTVQAAPNPMEMIGHREFLFLADLIASKSRIQLGPDKRALVTARLHRRLQKLGVDYKGYCEFLKTPAGMPEIRILVELVSTNFTYFFREQEHFDCLREMVLPEWISSFPHPSTAGKFRLWSAGSSTGEEAFSAAMIIWDFMQEHPSKDWQVEATDISDRVIDEARKGIYRTKQLQRVSREDLRQFFLKGTGPYDGTFRVKPFLRKKVNFQRLNFFDHPYPVEKGFQVIICRNVMIYFDRETQHHLCQTLSDYLAPGGYLMVGHSEGLITTFEHQLERVLPSVWRKSGNRERIASRRRADQATEKTTE